MRYQLQLLPHIALFALLISSSQTLSQQSKPDLLGYQDFRWGMSRSTVESMLKKQKAEIASSDEKHILIKSQLEFYGSLHPVDIEKSFIFRNNALGCVQLIYHHGTDPDDITKLQLKFREQLEKKYGKCDSDSTTSDENTTSGFLSWEFKSGTIYFTYHEVLESSSWRSVPISRLLDGIRLYYYKKGFDAEISREREKKISKEF